MINTTPPVFYTYFIEDTVLGRYAPGVFQTYWPDKGGWLDANQMAFRRTVDARYEEITPEEAAAIMTSQRRFAQRWAEGRA